MSIKAFVFDLDGVIVDTAVLHYEAWKKTLQEINIDYTKAENDSLKGLPRLATLEAILKLKNKSQNFTTADLVKIATTKNNLYKKLLKTEISVADILPGIEHLLTQAKNNNIKISLASSSRNAPSILKRLGLFKMFDYIVDPATIANGKPAPDIFIAACHGVNADVTEAVGFEDAIEGVKGLLAAKIKTVAITWGVNADWTGVAMQVKTTSELNFHQIINLKT